MTIHTPILDRAPRHDGWTPERKTRFLDCLAEKGNVRQACARVGLSQQAAYVLRRRDAVFARAWAAALALAREHSVQVLADRAIEGVEVQIWYRGELVGTQRKFDTRLLLAHIARLDALVDEKATWQDAGRFDELLAVVAGEAVPEGLELDGDIIPPDREAAGRLVGERMEEEYERKALEANAADREAEGVDGNEEDAAAFEDSCVEMYRAGCDYGEALWDHWVADACVFVDRAAGRLTDDGEPSLADGAAEDDDTACPAGGPPKATGPEAAGIAHPVQGESPAA